MAATPVALLTPREAGKLLRLGRDKTYQLIRNGEIPTVKLGQRRFVPVKALNAFIGEGENNA